MLTARDFFDLSGFLHRSIFQGDDRVWRALADLEDYLANKGYIPGNNIVKLRQELNITARQ
ncbi:MAG: hypothetical protein WD356_08720 [Pseudomonadales bacterium]